MSEADEVTSTLSRHLAAMASAAMGVAQLSQQRRAQRARQAQEHADEAQADTARKLHAERELAATQWAQADDSQWAAAQPEHVAQAWASAAAWEPFDRRAGRARQKFEEVLHGWGVDPQAAAEHIERGDQEALQTMLARAAQEHTHEAVAASGPSDYRQHGQEPAAEPTPAGAVEASQAPARGSVYSGGAEPSQLAGKSYPQTTAQALAQAATSRTRPGAARRETSQHRDTERGRDR